MLWYDNRATELQAGKMSAVEVSLCVDTCSRKLSMVDYDNGVEGYGTTNAIRVTSL